MTRDQVEIVLIAAGWAAAVGVRRAAGRLPDPALVVPVGDHAGRAWSPSSRSSPASSAPRTRCSCPATTSGGAAGLPGRRRRGRRCSRSPSAPRWSAGPGPCRTAPAGSARAASTSNPTAARPSCSELSAELARTSERLRESARARATRGGVAPAAGRLGLPRPAQPAGRAARDDRGARGRAGRRARALLPADALRGRPDGAHGRRPLRALPDPRRRAAACRCRASPLEDLVSEAIAGADPVARAAAGPARRVGRPGRDGARRPGRAVPRRGATWSSTPSGTRRPTASSRSPAAPSTAASSWRSPTGAAASPRTTCPASSTWPGAARTPARPRSTRPRAPAPASAWPSSRASSRPTTAMVQVVNETPGCRFLVRLPA